jgi:hypothetical protein
VSELKLESLISEGELAKGLKVSKESLRKLRLGGCPFLRIGGRIFYFEGDFMAWVLKNCGTATDAE